MPQMAPILWTNMFNMFMLMLMMVLTVIFFSHNYITYEHKSFTKTNEPKSWKL